jgi:hypothetical protein
MSQFTVHYVGNGSRTLVTCILVSCCLMIATTLGVHPLSYFRKG